MMLAEFDAAIAHDAAERLVVPFAPPAPTAAPRRRPPGKTEAAD
jgi:hypothetical protein